MRLDIYLCSIYNTSHNLIYLPLPSQILLQPQPFGIQMVWSGKVQEKLPGDCFIRKSKAMMM
jgi:hypothetical protein